MKIEESVRIFFALFNQHSSHHSLLNLAFHKKTRLGLLLLVFFFFFGLSLSSASDWEMGLFTATLLFDILSSALPLNVLSLFPLLLITLSLFPYLLIYFHEFLFFSFFFFEYLSFITSCSFWCVFIMDFHFLFRIEKRMYFFALLCFDISCQGLRYHEVLFLV